MLALWSFAVALLQACGQTTVSYFLARLLGAKPDTLRQRLREFCFDAQDKRGPKRRQLEVEACFAGLLGWVLGWWKGHQLALALDATYLGARFVVLAASVVYRGCAIPVAWKVLPANRPGSWRGYWVRLLGRLRQDIPRSMTVLVLADRGLYARWLFRRIRRLGWHPLLRVNGQGHFRPAEAKVFRPLASFAAEPGRRWSGRGTAFTKPESRLDCTLLACWEEGQKEPWLLLTDLPPEAAQASWYGLRAWVEHGFQVHKRGGWQWQRSRLTHPRRAARLWLVMAVATLWLVSVGGLAEVSLPEGTLEDVTDLLAQQRRARRATRRRQLSVFRQGWIELLVALLQQLGLPRRGFRPEPWPDWPAAPP